MAVVVIGEIRHDPDVDDVLVDGTVDGHEVKAAHCWYSHLYPPAEQDPESAAAGCQTDEERKAYLTQLLIDEYDRAQPPPIVPKTDTLQKFVTATKPSGGQP